MIVFKIDVLEELKAAGYNTNRIRNERIFGQATLTAMRKGICQGTKTLNTVCEILEAQPGLIIKWVPDEKDK